MLSTRDFPGYVREALSLWSILKAGFALVTDCENESDVRAGFVGVRRYAAALTVRDHELA